MNTKTITMTVPNKAGRSVGGMDPCPKKASIDGVAFTFMCNLPIPYQGHYFAAGPQSSPTDVVSEPTLIISMAMGEHEVVKYELIETSGPGTLLKVELETGTYAIHYPGRSTSPGVAPWDTGLNSLEIYSENMLGGTSTGHIRNFIESLYGQKNA